MFPIQKVSKENSLFIDFARMQNRSINTIKLFDRIEPIILAQLKVDIETIVNDIVKQIQTAVSSIGLAMIVENVNKALIVDNNPLIRDNFNLFSESRDPLFYEHFFPDFIDLNSLYYACRYVNKLPNHSNQPNNAIALPYITQDMIFDYSKSLKPTGEILETAEYNSLITEIEAIRKYLFENKESDLVAGSILERLAKLSFIRKETIQYLGRTKIIDLLNHYYCGILMEKKYAEVNPEI